MKLTYIANVRLPTEKAHGIQIMKMCQAFNNNGVKMQLVVPIRKQINPDLRDQDSFTYYQIKSRFTIKRILNLDLLPLHQIGINTGPFAYLVQELSFSLLATLSTFSHKHVFTRVKIVAFLRSILRKNVIYEAHDPATNSSLNKTISNRSKAIVCITRSIQKSWDNLGANTIYAPDGVGKEFFSKASKATARKKLHLPRASKIVLYTGNLYSWKGINTLLKATKRLPKYQFYFVGGSIIDNNIQPIITKTKKQPNIHIMGHKPYTEVPLWLKAADILVIPNSAKTKKGREDTSPLKLFEYLASGTNIIASQVPAITEIVTKNQVTFFQPDNVSDLAVKISKILNQKIHPQKAQSAIKLAKKYTWLNRAKLIIESI